MLKISPQLNQQVQAALEYYNINQKIKLSSIQKEMERYLDPWLYFDDFLRKTKVKFGTQAEQRALFNLLRKYWKVIPRQDLFGFSEEIKTYLEEYEREFLYSLKDKFGVRWGGLAQPVINQLRNHLVKIILKNLSLWYAHQAKTRFKAEFQSELRKFFIDWLSRKQAPLFNLSPLDYFVLENNLKDRAEPLDLINWRAGEVNILMELEGKKILRQKRVMKRIEKEMRWILRERQNNGPDFSLLDHEADQIQAEEGKKVRVYEVPLKEKFPVVAVAESYGNQALRVSQPFFSDTMVDRDIARFSQSAFVPPVKMGVALSMVWAAKRMGALDEITHRIALETLSLALNYHQVSLDALQGIKAKALFVPYITEKLIKAAEEIRQILGKIITDLKKGQSLR